MKRACVRACVRVIWNTRSAILQIRRTWLMAVHSELFDWQLSYVEHLDVYDRCLFHTGHSGGLPSTFGPRRRVFCHLWTKWNRSSCWVNSRATRQATLHSTHWDEAVACWRLLARPPVRCPKVHVPAIVQLKAQVLICHRTLRCRRFTAFSAIIMIY